MGRREEGEVASFQQRLVAQAGLEKIDTAYFAKFGGFSAADLSEFEHLQCRHEAQTERQILKLGSGSLRKRAWLAPNFERAAATRMHVSMTIRIGFCVASLDPLSRRMGSDREEV